MTTGSESYTGGGCYHSRSWSGTDGKYDADGALKLNPYDVSWYDSCGVPSRVFVGPAYDHYIDQTVLSGYCIPRGVTGLNLSDDDVQVSLSRLLKNIKGTDFNAGVFVGTMHQNIDPTIQAIGSVGNALLALKRGHVAAAFRSLGYHPSQRQLKRVRSGIVWDSRLKTTDISAAWLSMQYGWKPLLSDVFDMWDAYTRRDRLGAVLKVAGSSRRSQTFDGSCSPLYGRTTVTVECSVRHQAFLKEKLPLSRTLGLQDPASIIWELLPWSFVLDWFIPIGDYLENYNIASALRGDFVVTKRVKTKWQYQGPPPPTAFSWGVKDGVWIKVPTVIGGTCYGSSGSLHRSVSTSLHVPLPHFKSLPKAFSRGHIANAIALFHQQLSNSDPVRRLNLRFNR